MLYSSFTFVDAVVLIAVLAVIAAVIYFGFVKKSKNGGCKGCPYAKECPKTPQVKQREKDVACSCGAAESDSAQKSQTPQSEKKDGASAETQGKDAK